MVCILIMVCFDNQLYTDCQFGVMLALGLILCNIIGGFPIYNQGDWIEKVQGGKKDRTVRHLGHQHEVTIIQCLLNIFGTFSLHFTSTANEGYHLKHICLYPESGPGLAISSS